MIFKRKHNISREPIVPIPNNKARLLPKYGIDDEYFIFELDWLLSLKIEQKEFICDEDSYYTFTKISPQKKLYYFKISSANLKRAYGLTKSFDRGIGQISIFIKKDNEEDEYHSLFFELIGEHYPKQKLNLIFKNFYNSLQEEYELSKNKVFKYIDWIENIELILKQDEIIK